MAPCDASQGWGWRRVPYHPSPRAIDDSAPGVGAASLVGKLTVVVVIACGSQSDPCMGAQAGELSCEDNRLNAPTF